MTTLVRKSPKPRMWACAHCPQKNPSTKKKCQGCGIGRATKRTSLSTRCDTLWAQLVKAGGRCAVVAGGGVWVNIEAAFKLRPSGEWVQDKRFGARFPVCDGRLEAAHIVPRRHRTTRWDPANGRPLCHAHHRYFTDHEKAWRDFIGPEWDRLWEKAQTVWDKTFPLAELRSALAAKKEAA